MVNPEYALDSNFLGGLRWRCIGPPRGGRVVAVAGHPSEPMEFYFGACAGGVWKTDDGGTYWRNVSDGHFNSAAIGAIAVADADPNVVYAGTGETTIRGDVSYGDGVYRSTDAGKTWRHVGLKETRHIGKIRIHPTDPDLLYVAAMGHAFGPNSERGVYRSRDGGAHWEQVLYRSEKAGAVDLSMDPNNPRILFASVWEVYRNFWKLSSGGPDSGLFKSVDGGDTWKELSNNKGMPQGIKGKIGVAVSPANSERIFALVEAEKGGLYRSDDSGEEWELVSDHADLMGRPWYYCHLCPDPNDENTVWVPNIRLWKSIDGGATFDIATTPHADNHDMWIDPADSQRMIQGSDGGACVSFNGGRSWSTIYNQLTAQFYRLDVDTRFPYRVYATQQDNSSICVPSATEFDAIPMSDCYPVGSGESGYMAVHPTDPDIAYIGAVGSSPGGGGALQRYDLKTHQIRLVTAWPESYFGWDPKDLKYRFNWTFPIRFSPHDPDVLYCAGNVVFKTTDEGNNWEVISPDLTRNDPETTEASGGPLTLDCSGAEHYATIYSLVESLHEPGVIWAGSDDGLVHLTRDGGQSWNDVTPAELPRAQIGTVEVSPHAPATVFIAATRYKFDDYRAYLFSSDDYGKTWRDLSAGFPPGEISRVVREDLVRPGLLFVGTETGVCFSLDSGATWQRLETNLPVVPVYDLKIKDDDLVAATHGRSFWILDDLTPLRTVAPDRGREAASLFTPRPTPRRCLNWMVDSMKGPGKNYQPGLGSYATFEYEDSEDGETTKRFLDAGENPPNGLMVFYHLNEKPEEPLTLRFLEADGREIKSFASRSPDEDEKNSNDTDDERADKEEKKEKETERYAPAGPGLNRFVWDMSYPDAEKLVGEVLAVFNASTGPRAAPGNYRVELTVGEQSWTEPFQIVADPRVDTTPDDFSAQFVLGQRIRDKVDAVHHAVNRIRRIRRQIGEWEARADEIRATAGPQGASFGESVGRLKKQLSLIEGELVQTEAKTILDCLRLPDKLSNKLTTLIGVVRIADARPPQQAYEVFDLLSSQADDQLLKLEDLVVGDLAAFNDLLRSCALPPVSVDS